MKTIVKASLLAALLAAGSTQAADLITNGGFEMNNAASNGSGPGYVYAGDGAMAAGWTFADGAGVTLNNTAWGGTTPAPSTAFAFLQNVSSVSQSFTSGAANYSLSFDLSGRAGYGHDQAITVSVDNKAVSTYYVTSDAWGKDTLALGNLSAGSHTISFTGSNKTGDSSAFLDNVSVTAAVPEPETYGMLLGGLGLLGFVARRRRNAK